VRLERVTRKLSCTARGEIAEFLIIVFIIVIIIYMFCLDVKLRLLLVVKGTICGSMRSGCFGEYLDPREMTRQEDGGNFIRGAS
jgi:hypothetical protein